MREVEVELGDRSYKIVIGEGVIESAGAHIAALAPGARCAVVTDENVAALHLDALKKSLLRTPGFRSSVIVCPPGEATKSYSEFARVSDALIAAHIERRDLVVALGGGVIGDLAGFCAASLRRGVRLVQIPTTLLAQVDSSVGGKTAINSQLGQEFDRRVPSALARARRFQGARHLEPARISRGIRRSRQIRPYRRSRLFRVAGGSLARGSRRRTRAAATPLRRAARQRRARSPRTRPSRARARCSISAIPSATRSRL